MDTTEVLATPETHYNGASVSYGTVDDGPYDTIGYLTKDIKKLSRVGLLRVLYVTLKCLVR